MPQPSDHVAHSARRAQFRVVNEPSRAKIRVVDESSGKRKEAPAGRAGIVVRRKSIPGGPPPKSLGLAGTVPASVLLYRRWLADVGHLVVGYDAEDRDGFFHLMKLMNMLGLKSEDVVAQLRFTPETIARWINGSRTPHIEMRQYILEKCFGILREIADAPLPRDFVRLGD